MFIVLDREIMRTRKREVHGVDYLAATVDPAVERKPAVQVKANPVVGALVKTVDSPGKC